MCEVCKGSAQVSRTVPTLAFSFLFWRYQVKMSTSRQSWWYPARANGLNQCFQWSLRWKISSSWHYHKYLPSFAHPSGCMVWGVGLQPLTCWDCGFESHQGHGCLSLVSVVCCQVEISVRGQLLVQRSPTKYGVSECDLKTSTMRRPGPTGGCRAMKETTPFHEIDCTIQILYPWLRQHYNTTCFNQEQAPLAFNLMFTLSFNPCGLNYV